MEKKKFEFLKFVPRRNSCGTCSCLSLSSWVVASRTEACDLTWTGLSRRKDGKRDRMNIARVHWNRMSWLNCIRKAPITRTNMFLGVILNAICWTLEQVLCGALLCISKLLYILLNEHIQTQNRTCSVTQRNGFLLNLQLFYRQLNGMSL